MIQANVAAAETLEARKSPLVYRIHDSPSMAKLEALRDFLKSIELSLPKGGNLRPAQFNRLLERVDGDRARTAAQRGGAAHPGAGRIQPGEHRPFRPQPPPLRPLHLADPPLCRPHRPPRAGPLAEARRRRPARRHRGSNCPRSRRRSPPPSAAPWRPSATPSTGWSPTGSPTASAPPSPGASPASPAPGSSSSSNETGADGFVPMRTLGADYFHYDEARHAVIGSALGRDAPARRRGRGQAGRGGAAGRRAALRAAERGPRAAAQGAAGSRLPRGRTKRRRRGPPGRRTAERSRRHGTGRSARADRWPRSRPRQDAPS